MDSNKYFKIYEDEASCCGHSVYPMTIVVKYRKNGIAYYFELLSGVSVFRIKKFYKKDKNGIYYIPEVCDVRDK